MRQPRSACQCGGMAGREISQPFMPTGWVKVCGWVRDTASTLNAGVETHEGRGLQSEGVIGSRH
jgi:hypothetical protein